MSDYRIVRRCCECGFILFDGEPYTTTDNGYCHPICEPEDAR